MYGDADVYCRVGEHPCLEHACVRRLVAEGGIHPFRHSDTRHHADVAEEGGNRNAFHDNQPEDRKGLCTQRLAYAELACALLDGNQHDVRYAYDTA